METKLLLARFSYSYSQLEKRTWKHEKPTVAEVREEIFDLEAAIKKGKATGKTKEQVIEERYAPKNGNGNNGQPKRTENPCPYGETNVTFD